VVILARKHLPGAAHARLHFVDNQKNSMLVADAAQSSEKILRRGHVTTFALNSLDHDPGNFFRRRRSLEQTLFNPVKRALSCATVAAVSRTERIAKLV